MNPKQIDYVFYALPYDPYGKDSDYSWPFPMRWFNINDDECVLIGHEFWGLIGGIGTYKAYISEVNSLGKEYRKRILLGVYRDGTPAKH